VFRYVDEATEVARLREKPALSLPKGRTPVNVGK